jgi:Ca-activated chloride channel family protein
MVRYVYPLSTERFSSQPLQEVRVTIRINSKLPVSNIYSPSHEVDVKQTSPTTAIVEWKGTNLKPDRDLVLYYAVSDEEFPIQILTHHEPGQPGYFMLLASPKPADSKPMPKEVVFVLDRTGSMSGKKIEQAKSALTYCLNSLKPADRFNVLVFNENTTWFKDGLVPGAKPNINAAVKMVEETDAEGGTNIDKALGVALAQYHAKSTGSGHPYIVFLTDGQPTVGLTDTQTILKNVKEKNADRNVRLFVFGVGDDVNAQFLDRLAQEHKADADYVRPSEDIEVKVTSFFDKVTDPLLINPTLSVSGATVSSMHPGNTLPDMFKGGQLIVIGKYSGAGEATFTLSGEAKGKSRTFRSVATLPNAEADNDFIPRLWAAREIGYLLDEIRLRNSQELIDEVVRLSREFGIPTEFTSFIADEREQSVSSAEDRRRATDALNAATKQNTGGWAVNQSANARSLRNQSTLPGASQRDSYVNNVGGAPAAVGGFKSYDGSGFGTTNTYMDQTGRVVSVNTIQNVGTRTFYRKTDQWVDARYQTQKVFKIRQYSEAHFQLLAANPELRKYSTLGNVTVVVNANAVEIGAEGKEKLSSSDMKEILGRT